jgi:nucleotide-binding universal stress UspA family protein
MTTVPIRNIAFVTDLGPDSQTVFAQALGVALLAGADLFPLEVRPPGSSSPQGALPGARSVLERWGRLSPGSSEWDVRALGLRVHPLRRVGGGPLGDELALTEPGAAPDLVILSPAHDRPRDAAPRELGLPALFLPPRGRPFVSVATGEVCVQRVVVPVGPGPESGEVLAALAELLLSVGVTEAHFVLVHVGTWSTVPLERLPSRPNQTFRLEVRSGAVVQQILEAVDAHHADLVAMASLTHRPHRSGVFGSTTGRVSRLARCPLLTLPIDTDARPVTTSTWTARQTRESVGTIHASDCVR